VPANADGAPGASESLENFFDKLDEAFANLAGARREIAASEDDDGTPAPESRGGSPGLRAAAPAAATANPGDDWDIDMRSTSDTQLPSFLAPHDDVGRPPAPPPPMRAGAAQSAGSGNKPSPLPETQAMPALAEAFAALLAAEQPGGEPVNTAAWARPPSPAVMDELVERVTQRVLERLSDRAVREATTAAVSSVAERLVGDEIDRFKAAIKKL
jgi:hypothetical protein